MIFVRSTAVSECLQLNLDQHLRAHICWMAVLSCGAQTLSWATKVDTSFASKVAAAGAPSGPAAPVICVAIGHMKGAQSSSYALDRSQSSTTMQSTFYAGRACKPNGCTSMVWAKGRC